MPYPDGMRLDAITEVQYCTECGGPTSNEHDICRDCYFADSIADRD